MQRKTRFGLGTLGTAALATLAVLSSQLQKGAERVSDKVREKQAGRTEADIRAEVVSVAGSQMGYSDPEPYWVDTYGSYPGEHFAWCGVFALWVLRQVGLTTERWHAGEKGPNGKPIYGFIFPLHLPSTSEPQPGDIAYFTKNQHHAIVAAVAGDIITLINGNGKGGAVSLSQIEKSEAAGFFSIRPLVVAKLENAK